MFPHNEFENIHHEKPHQDEVEQIKQFQSELNIHLDEQLKAKKELIELVKKNLEQAKNETQ